MIVPVLHFPGTCSDAIRLYEKAFAVTDKQIQLFREAPPDSGLAISDGMLDKVMHGRITICGTEFNCSDIQEEVTTGNMMLFNVFVENEEEVHKAYKTLQEGGKIAVAIGPQFFSKLYASVEDRFGIRWQLILI